MIPMGRAKGRILDRWRKARRRLLILDLDGTLAPIMPRPSDVRLSNSMKRVLELLAADRSTRVAVISGRWLRDLRRRVPVEGLWLAGNHGLEVAGQGLHRPAKAALTRRWMKRMHLFAEKARRSFMTVQGAYVEDKHLTLSIHYRNVPQDLYPQFFGNLWYLKGSAASRKGRWTRGKMVWEFRPPLDWDKGKAAKHMMHRFRPSEILVIGDDTTDEDMFRSLSKRAITVRVGASRASAARYYLSSQTDVEKFLEDLTEAA